MESIHVKTRLRHSHNEYSKTIKIQSRSRSLVNTSYVKSPFDNKIAQYASEIRNKIKHGLKLTEIPFFCDNENLELLLFSFSKVSRNSNDILLIEHYLITFPNLMKTIYQKKYLYDTSELLHKIAVFLKCEQIQKHSLICRLGEIGDKFYLIFQGSVAILIPRELKVKMTMTQYIQHLFKLFSLKEYDLIMRTIISNNYIFMSPEIYELKTKLENEQSLYLASSFKEIISIEDYIARLNPSNDNDNSINQNVIIWSYYYVTKITQGQTFGDIALSDETKRRTASIISIEDTYCGTLHIQVYKNCIRDAQERIHKANINFLLSFTIFNEILPEVFDRKYFNFFKQMSLKRNSILFSQREKRMDIYFLKEGEIEMSFKGTYTDLNTILRLKGVNPDITRECIYEKINEGFGRFYREKGKVFKIFNYVNKGILGLDDILDNEKAFLFSCRCVTDKVELFAIEIKLFNEFIHKEQRREKLVKILEEKNENLIKRIMEIKNVQIEKRAEVFVNVKDLHCVKVRADYVKNMKTLQKEMFNFKGNNFIKKRINSAAPNKKKKTINKEIKQTEFKNTNIFNNVKKFMINKVRGLISLNNILKYKNNTQINKSKKIIVNDNTIIRNIFDNEAKMRNDTQTQSTNNSRSNSLELLAVDRALEKRSFILKKTNSSNSIINSNYTPKQLTIETKGKMKIIKSIKPPRPKILPKLS